MTSRKQALDDKFKLEKWAKQKRPQRAQPSAAMSIYRFFHCRQCVESIPPGSSMREYAQLEVGSTEIGFQIWCKRHDCNIMHIDFEECVHPANLRRENDERKVQ